MQRYHVTSGECSHDSDMTRPRKSSHGGWGGEKEQVVVGTATVQASRILQSFHRKKRPDSLVKVALSALRFGPQLVRPRTIESSGSTKLPSWKALGLTGRGKAGIRGGFVELASCGVLSRSLAQVCRAHLLDFALANMF
jgi:hypothetical protein